MPSKLAKKSKVWRKVNVPGVIDAAAYALEITGDASFRFTARATPSLFRPRPRCGMVTALW